METDKRLDARAAEIVSEMSLEEKTALLQGKDFWHMEGNARFGLPEMMMTDGPHGLRKQAGSSDHMGLGDSVPATCFPTASVSACSFDPELLEEMGAALGEECLREEVGILLGPGVNHKRSPLCGRNFEYFSEDPVLTGKMAAGLIRGIQSTGVGACLKHFAANDQEKMRQIADSVVDERAMREIYLRQFEIAVKEGDPCAVMTSYNRINGVYGSENAELMEHIARSDWDFRGIFITDWGAFNEPVESYRNGLDLEMPGSCRGTAEIVAEAVRSGTLPGETLDRIAARLVSVLLRYRELKTGEPFDTSAHLYLAQRVAEESAVLLKNERNALPLRPGSSVAVLGYGARHPRYQGSGSSRVNCFELDDLWSALSDKDLDCVYAEGFGEDGSATEEQISAAVEAARGRDAVVIVAGLPDSYESEGFDRTSLDMPEGENRLITAVAEINPNVIVLLQCGGPVSMPWLDRVRAVLYAGLAGCQGGKAAAALLTGETVPSGKLAETWPFRNEDAPCDAYYLKTGKCCQYRESIFTGYRYYDSAEKPVQFPFGHGLSYTEFEYGGIALSTERLLRDGKMTASFIVKNTGDCRGKETVQLYIGQDDPQIFRPKKELKAFRKIALEPGEEQRLSFTLDYLDFAYFDQDIHAWRVEEGRYTIYAAASSADIRLTCTVTVEGNVEHERRDYRKIAPSYYDLSRIGRIPDGEFSELLGRPLPDARPRKPYDRNISLGELAENSLFYRLVIRVIRGGIRKKITDPEMRKQAEIMLEEMPLRGFGMTGGLTKYGIEGLVDLVNGHPIRGVKKLRRKLAEGKGSRT